MNDKVDPALRTAVKYVIDRAINEGLPAKFLAAHTKEPKRRKVLAVWVCPECGHEIVEPAEVVTTGQDTWTVEVPASNIRRHECY